jgi:peptide/nickel transport system permease protein
VLSDLLRRLLWLLPTLLFVSAVTFWGLALAPHPSGTKEQADARIEADLPLFFNRAPLDVRARAERAARLVARDDPDAAWARNELARLGGAALPHLVPALDGYAAEERARIAVALAPVARRARLPRAELAESAETSVAYWSRFWIDRGSEFRTAAVEVAVERAVRYGDEARARELEQLDTFVLPALFERLAVPETEVEIARARGLVAIVAHVAESNDRLALGASLPEARACVERWLSFWSEHEADFVTFDSATRAAAMVRQTRYARWATSATRALIAPSIDEAQRRDEALGAATTSGLRLAASVSIGYLLALLLWTAADRAPRARRAIQRGLDLAQAGQLALVVAVAQAPLTRPALEGLGIAVLALGFAALPLRAIAADADARRNAPYHRALAARGVGRDAQRRHIYTFAARPWLVLLTLEPPIALLGVVALELASGLHGLGPLFVRALAAGDTSFVVAISVGAALATSVLLALSDGALAALDPRAASVFRARRAR